VSLTELKVSTAQIGADAYVVSLAGELDLHSAGEFERELDAVIERGALRVIVDLIGITFIDSVSLGLLTRGAKQLRASGGECVVVSDDPRIIRVFEITGLDRIFRLERSLAEAVEQLVGATSR
jgi:anti-sigma B factor antagonist